MRSLENLLTEYSESHQNQWNRWIHKICVPLIFISLYAILFAIPFPSNKSMYNNCGTYAYLIALVFWYRWSWKLGLFLIFFGLILAAGTMFYWVWNLKRLDYLLAKFASILFIIGWIGQFIGHYLEGKKPSFLKDLQFLLIGPIWIFKGK